MGGGEARDRPLHEGGRAARESATSPLPALRDPSVGGQFNKNPGKRGLSLNVADPRGLAIAKALLAKCDVVAEGFSPACLSGGALAMSHRSKSGPGRPAGPAPVGRVSSARSTARV